MLLIFFLISLNARAETLVRYQESTILQKLNTIELKIENGLQPSSVVLEIDFGGGQKASSAGFNLGGYQDVKALREDLMDPNSKMLIIVPRSGNGFSIREDRQAF